MICQSLIYDVPLLRVCLSMDLLKWDSIVNLFNYCFIDDIIEDNIDGEYSNGENKKSINNHWNRNEYRIWMGFENKYAILSGKVTIRGKRWNRFFVKSFYVTLKGTRTF